MDAIDELLTRGVEKIYPSRNELEKLLRSGKKLRLYQGFDPTGTLLHIGHLVGLRKLRQFQDLGHQVIFLIGDGTGQAGDPSGKSKSRDKYLTRDELRQNAKDYVFQAKKIVNFEGKNPVQILYNGDWLNKLNLVDLLNLFGKFSVQQLIERDIFQNRIKENKPINLREFIYPLLQGYDSVAMQVDLEIGGTDQTFNMLTGRELVKRYLDKEKFVLTLPLLSDSSGRKIGKTEGNVIALTAQAKDLYGMIMNLPDEVIIKCFEFITDLPLAQIREFEGKLKGQENPMTYKKKLAFRVVKMLNDESKAINAQEYFETTFQKKQLTLDMPAVKIAGKSFGIVDLLMELKLVKSRGDAKRLIREGAVDIDNKMIDDLRAIEVRNGMVIKVGKHKLVKLISRQ